MGKNISCFATLITTMYMHAVIDGHAHHTNGGYQTIPHVTCQCEKINAKFKLNKCREVFEISNSVANLYI